MPVGVVYTTFHYPVTGANVVTTEHSDWATNCPEYKVTAVQVALARRPDVTKTVARHRGDEDRDQPRSEGDDLPVAVLGD
jgi:formate dehydrogenase major subunit